MEYSLIVGALATALEKSANAALRYDPGTRAALNKLAGKILAVESQLPPLTLYLAPQPADAEVGLTVEPYSNIPADTHLKGPLAAILALILSPQHSLANSGVTVSGSSGFLSDFQDVMSQVDIDWEEPVNQLLGNTLGHQFAELVRSQFQWASSRTSKAQEFMGDYLAEELRAVPGQAEMTGFYDGVDQVRSATDRLAARIQHLNQQFNSRQGD